ncbi:carboxylesterase family protein [Hypomontagnella monticulosa]|nr:carboxylesterase family protein [Hypomontagnella monticulosa]
MIGQIVLLGFLALATVAKTDSALPKLELPWGTWQASVYENDTHIYLFRNVRFGAPPERFNRSLSPDWKDNTLQNIKQDISCIQVNASRPSDSTRGTPHLEDPENSDELQSEDCLFLDIYVPSTAFRPLSPFLPVVVWIYGGGYAFGSKNPHGPLNTGQSLLRASNYQTIFVTGNYRIGAFGWLSGDYMQTAGQPNAGLYDQALLLEWVHTYIHRVRGDRTRVSAWGESAGAGSILHHLIREDGTHDPLFSTFAVQSPAFQWAWDNSPGGELDKTYKRFSDLAGCGSKYNIKCLRTASLEKLVSANQKLFNDARNKSVFPVGPAVDGKWVTTIPTVAFSQGRFWHGIKSGIISHCANESQAFTPKINSSEKFDEFLCQVLPGPDRKPQRDAIKKQYNCTESFNGNFHKCLAAVIQDSLFTCNTRDLFESCPTATYMMKYEFPQAEYAFHAVDLIPLFINNPQEAIWLLESVGVNSSNATDYAKGLDYNQIPHIYQNYFASFALSGDPNKGRPNPPKQWTVVNGSGNNFSDVMGVKFNKFPSHAFYLTVDDQNNKTTCSFWTEIAKEITASYMTTDSERVLQDVSHFEEL